MSGQPVPPMNSQEFGQAVAVVERQFDNWNGVCYSGLFLERCVSVASPSPLPSPPNNNRRQRQRRRFYDDNYYTCTLCQRTNLRGAELPSHSEEPLHQERLNKLNHRVKLLKVATTKVARVCSKSVQDKLDVLDQVRHQASRDSVYADLYHYVVSGDDDNPNHCLLQSAFKKVKLATYYERLTILATAVWKAQCLLQMSKSDSGSYFESQDWVKSGWKKCKHEQRESNAIAIIVGSVQPYLDRPTP